MTTERLTANDRRDQLLAIALHAFARDGYHETSMNDVATAAGVTKPVLYQHFQSKRDLFLAVLEHVGENMISSFRSATAAATSGREQTAAGFVAYFRWVAEHRASFRVLFGGGARQDEEFAMAVRRFTAVAAEVIAPLIDAGIDREHQLTIAHAIVGMSEGACRRLLDGGGDFDADVIAEQLSEFAWAGLRGLGQHAGTAGTSVG